MAADLSAVSPSKTAGIATKRVTMDSTPGEVVAVTLPSWATAVSITWRTSAGADAVGWYTGASTDGAAKGDDAAPVAAGDTLTLDLIHSEAGQQPVLYLASDAASGYAYLTLTR